MNKCSKSGYIFLPAILVFLNLIQALPKKDLYHSFAKKIRICFFLRIRIQAKISMRIQIHELVSVRNLRDIYSERKRTAFVFCAFLVEDTSTICMLLDAYNDELENFVDHSKFRLLALKELDPDPHSKVGSGSRG
jgi:hypothetical protein